MGEAHDRIVDMIADSSFGLLGSCSTPATIEPSIELLAFHREEEALPELRERRLLFLELNGARYRVQRRFSPASRFVSREGLAEQHDVPGVTATLGARFRPESCL